MRINEGQEIPKTNDCVLPAQGPICDGLERFGYAMKFALQIAFALLTAAPAFAWIDLHPDYRKQFENSGCCGCHSRVGSQRHRRYQSSEYKIKAPISRA